MAFFAPNRESSTASTPTEVSVLLWGASMLSVPEDVLANYAKDILKNKQTLQNIIDRAVEEKLAGWLKEQVELDTKEVTADEFNKLFEE